MDNSVTYNVLEENPHLLTTKEDAEQHGIGMRIIRRIVEQNGGMLHYEMVEPKVFSVQVMLRV